ncbi:MAG: hypothetical protein LBK57_08215 [Clostridiales Family XIII bacterium]|jgi:5S rRNA maturation endonuclease (ribonuclease M5)|nr:hypothetical protein [Clostridiales Family XIII bacterium]
MTNRYKWLLVVEGETDVTTYKDLLKRYGVPSGDIALFSASGKGNVCNAENWAFVQFDDTDLLSTLIQDSGRTDFCGVILLVDTDADGSAIFENYKRNTDTRLHYVTTSKPQKEQRGECWYLDSLNGVQEIPVLGIAVPMNGSGCLETDLLNSYGFPVEGQDEYAQFVDIIQKSSSNWQIPLKNDGTNWWKENSKAKLDKFIYSALSHGFMVSRRTPQLPCEPSVIGYIKLAIGIS